MRSRAELWAEVRRARTSRRACGRRRWPCWCCSLAGCDGPELGMPSALPSEEDDGSYLVYDDSVLLTARAHLVVRDRMAQSS